MFLGISGVIGLLSCTLYQYILCILYNCFYCSPAELPSPFYINKYDKLNGILYAQCAFTEWKLQNKKFQMKKGNPKNVLRQHLEQGANVPTSATTMRILASWIDVFGTSHHKHPAKKKLARVNSVQRNPQAITCQAHTELTSFRASELQLHYRE